eukprot:TRINITY_DN2818_c0_g1_i1.p1 TRINITY_DN2818_c0_g1~~TRINITY_DN2818_c0_g1_i1.p1  ORF type:complete len:309 (-),score=54.96 TRINITY_DN2818_c0_g1_i1:1220-2146(-)
MSSASHSDGATYGAAPEKKPQQKAPNGGQDDSQPPPSPLLFPGVRATAAALAEQWWDLVCRGFSSRHDVSFMMLNDSPVKQQQSASASGMELTSATIRSPHLAPFTGSSGDRDSSGSLGGEPPLPPARLAKIYFRASPLNSAETLHVLVRPEETVRRVTRQIANHLGVTSAEGLALALRNRFAPGGGSSSSNNYGHGGEDARGTRPLPTTTTTTTASANAASPTSISGQISGGWGDESDGWRLLSDADITMRQLVALGTFDPATDVLVLVAWHNLETYRAEAPALYRQMALARRELAGPRRVVLCANA